LFFQISKNRSESAHTLAAVPAHLRRRVFGARFDDFRLGTDRESHGGCELPLVGVKAQEGRGFQQPRRSDMQNIEGSLTAAQGVKLGKTRSLSAHGRKIQRHKLELSRHGFLTGRPSDFQPLKLPAFAALNPSFARIAAAWPERLPERQ